MNNQFQIDRIPPQACEVERTVLGSCILDPAVIAQARELLSEDCFYATQNRKIWACLCAMVDDGTPLDIITLCDCLKKRDEFEAIGAEPYLSELTCNVATTANIEHHCRILVEKAILRKAIQDCGNIASRAFEGESSETIVKSLATLDNDLRNRMDEAKMGSENQVTILTIKDLEPLTMEYYRNGEQAQVFELKTLPNLALIYKPALGFLNVFTGIPGHGKTGLLNQIMVDLSVNHNWKWLVFSPESYPHYYMVQDLAEKLIGKGMHRGEPKITEEELSGAITMLNDHIRIIDIGSGEFTSDNLLSIVREETAKNSIQGVVVDPIGDLEISTRKSENLTYSIRRFLRLIRLMGRRKEYSPYIVAHTTKIQKDLKTHKYLIPTLYDIDGSASFYNSCFQGLTTYRYYKINVVAVHVQKIKFKPSGEIGVKYIQYNRDNGVFSPYYLDPVKVEKEMVEQQEAKF